MTVFSFLLLFLFSQTKLTYIGNKSGCPVSEKKRESHGHNHKPHVLHALSPLLCSKARNAALLSSFCHQLRAMTSIISPPSNKNVGLPH